MPKVNSGRTEVYEVYRGAAYYSSPEMTEDGPQLMRKPAEHAATFWDRDEAGAFLLALTGRQLRPLEFEDSYLGGDAGQRRTKIIVAGGLAFHSVNKDGVPLGFIYAQASQAAADYLAAHAGDIDGRTAEALQDLAGSEGDARKPAGFIERRWGQPV